MIVDAMEYIGLSLIIWLLFVLCWHFTTSILIDWFLNRSNRKKRKKGQNIWDWLWFKRFRDVLPKQLLLWNCVNFVLWPLTGFSLGIIRLIGVSDKLCRFILGGLLILMSCILDLYSLSVINPFTHKRNPWGVWTRKKRNKQE